jgi:DnaJ domain
VHNRRFYNNFTASLQPEIQIDRLDDYLGTPLDITTIRITDKQIEIIGDWNDGKVLMALRVVEMNSGQRAFWTGKHYTFPIAALPVVEDVFKHRVELPVNWIGDTVTRDTTQTIAVFLEYCGNCRSRQSKQQQRMICKTCSGSGLKPNSGYGTRSGVSARCNTCGGNGTIAAYPDVEPYASGWWNDGWNIRFPLSVLKAYFGEPPATFDGNFHNYLLKSSNMKSAYWTLAKKYHPDCKGGNSTQFRKLAEAYATLSDPKLRKRYEAGLKFQQLTAQVKNDVVFEVPHRCGDLLVTGQYDESVYDGANAFWMKEEYMSSQRIERLLVVSKIINWNDRIDPQGRIMTSTWNPRETGNFGRGQRRREQSGERPFTLNWEQPPVEFVINI